jgi:ElaB/YqjD/DUF883 family membrane-anchored ribosome-binding protein
MSRMENPAQKGTVDQLKEKASEVGQNLREMGQQARQAANEQIGQLRDTAADYYQQGREKAAEYYQQGREKAVEFEQNLEGYIREQPVKSVLIAAGVGLLLGILWRRS